MIIKLIKSAKDDVIHGTDNSKKTACGINFQKDAHNFMEAGTSEDILPLTCEKCRIVLAKKIINEDKKERKRLIKEEKLREKKGIVDENIISLAGRHAKPADEFSEPEFIEENQPAVENDSPDIQNPVSQPVSPYMNSELAQFAIPAPPPVTENEKTAEKVQDNNDFLAQFAVQKPVEETETVPEPVAKEPVHSTYDDEDEDDFLSHFTMPESFNQTSNFSDSNDSEFDFLDDTPTVSAEEVYGETISPDEEFSYLSNNNENSDDEADFLSQFDISGLEKESVKNTDDSISKPADMDFLSQFNISKETEPETASSPNEIINDDQWNNVANSLFNDEKDNSSTEISSEENIIDEIPEIPDIPDITDSEPETENTIDDITVPVLDEIPEIPDISDITDSEPETENTIDDITVPVLDEIPEIPDIPDITDSEPETENAIDDINVPVLDEIPEIPDIPDIMDSEPEPENTIDDITVPVLDEITENSDKNDEKADLESSLEISENNINSDEEDDEEMKRKKSMYQYTSPVFKDETEKNTPPVQPSAFPSFMGNSQPQIMNIPQFVGYAPDGSPMYQYIPSQFVGYDANNQPIFIPLQMPVNNNIVPPAMNQQNIVPPVMNNPAPVINQQNAVPPVMNNPAPVINQQNSVPPVMNNPAPVINQQNIVPPVMNNPAPVINQQNAVPPVMNNPAPDVNQQNSVPPVMPKSNINISYLATEQKKTPSAFANAIAESTKKKNSNLFDMQESAEMPTIITSIEDAFSQVSGEKIKKNTEKKDDNISGLFEEYKGPSSTKKKGFGTSSSTAKKASAQPDRPLTKEEIKAKKKQEKIDAKFKKDLAKRGF